MRILVVSGIWPPDVGGPASHAPELAAFLRARGHGVEVITTADRAPAPQEYPVDWVDRGLPPGVRHAEVVRRIARAARCADVVYATTMLRRSAIATVPARTPLVVKVTADEAYERARRAGRFTGNLDEFQTWKGDATTELLRRTRTWGLRRAAHAFFPSAYLQRIATAWGVEAARTSVVPNPAPDLPELPSAAEARASFGIEGPTFAFAGRLMAAKALDVGLRALSLVPGATLLVAGDGPDRAAHEALAASLGIADRVRFLGAVSRDDVLRAFRAADAMLLCSAWENFPHTVVEALACGTPVVATTVGGVPEIVVEGANGLLVRNGDADALAAALQRVLGEPGLQTRLAAGAAPSVAHLRADDLLEQVERRLVEVGS